MSASTIGTKRIGGTVVAPRAPGSGARRQRSRSRRTSTAERYAIYVTAAIAGLLSLLSPAEPTSFLVTNALFTFAFAAGVTLAASRARRWT